MGLSESPEFEFNPCFPSPTSLHSADQLFFQGHLLPLHLLNNSESSVSELLPPLTHPTPSNLSTSPTVTSSKRWRSVFLKTDKKPATENEDKTKTKDNHKNRDKEKKREIRKKNNANSSAELNINLWPFSRSRSAGNNSSSAVRTKSPAPRKVSSAPCSRSNSAGDSKTRRSGVHLSRTSPVWQLPRTVSGKKDAGETSRRSKANKGRVLSLTVPMCIGYRPSLTCRSDEASVAAAGEDDTVAAASRGNLFNLRNLFTKKVY